MTQVTCTRRLEWDAMHRVPGHHGACRAFHGHRYAAEITCAGAVQADGMIVDFGLVKSLVGTWIAKTWDHTALFARDDPDETCQVISRANALYNRPAYFLEGAPTAENLAAELARVAQDLLSAHNIVVEAVKLWETPNCSALWRRADR
jgi:6-pyruvoyltetrahydropterin/6-carboxytetrahydropterin synthase